MRPVSEQFRVTQDFGSLATGGVVGNPNGTMVQILVSMYGDYQHDGHAGTDIGCPVGTPVRAARSGTVVLCDWDVNLAGDDSWSASGYFQRFAFYKRFGGRLLVIKVAPNDYDVYAHLSAWKVGYGQQVSEGQLVALSGDSSAGLDGQLGPHLHTERIVDLTYSTGGGLIFGRTDPTSVWGGIAAQGTITPLEDDMPLTDDDIKRIADAVHTRQAKRPNGGTNTLEWSLGAESERTEGIIARTAEATARLILGTKFKRQGEGQAGDTDLGSVIAWSDNNFTHAGTANLGASTGLDPNQVNAAIKAGLDAALAGTQATITLGGK